MSASVNMNPAQYCVPDQKLIFDVQDLHVAINGKTALAGVGISVRAHEVSAVIGPSGSGKSTLLKVMNRTLELTPGAKILKGDIRFKGEVIYGRDTDAQLVRKRICMVHQKPVAFPMSLKENILFGIRFHQLWNGRSGEEIVETYLERSGLWNEVKDRIHEPASRLSVGQLQRLCIARALANDPEALLMDEPCSALDPLSTAKIEDLIHGLKQELPIIIVTHNLAQAQRISDHSLFISEGRSLEEGPTGQLFTDPRNERVRDFITGRIG